MHTWKFLERVAEPFTGSTFVGGQFKLVEEKPAATCSNIYDSNIEEAFIGTANKGSESHFCYT